MMRFKNMLKHFSKTEVQEDKTHPCHLSQTILNRLFGRVLEMEGVSISCAEHTEKNLSSNRPIVLTTFKKVAFTLAEVLITLGIIGVVAALTLPTLIANHQKQTYVTGLKKAYSNLQNAFAKMAYDEDVTEWSQTSCSSFGLYGCTMATYFDNKPTVCIENLKKQLKVIDSTSEIGNVPTAHSGTFANFKTAEGILYTLTFGPGAESFLDDDGNTFTDLTISEVSVDVNGDKGPNKIGRDRFKFIVNAYRNKIEPYGVNYNYNSYCTTANVNSDHWGASTCTAKVLIEGKMDY